MIAKITNEYSKIHVEASFDFNSGKSKKSNGLERLRPKSPLSYRKNPYRLCVSEYRL